LAVQREFNRQDAKDAKKQTRMDLMRNHYQGTRRGPETRRRTEALPFNHPLPAVYRGQRGDVGAGAQGELARDAQMAWLEAVLLAADEPLPLRKLATAAGIDDIGAARRLVRTLHSLYEKEGSAFQIEELAGGFQLLTRPEFHPWLVRMRRSGAELKLTAAARETLTIIAYRQPITRADVEAVRGVHCGDVLRFLMERSLVRIAGRHDSLGRPVLYGTTKKFLQLFGLKSVKDLPQAEKLLPG